MEFRHEENLLVSAHESDAARKHSALSNHVHQTGTDSPHFGHKKLKRVTRMQTSLVPSDPKIEDSELFKFIKETFKDLDVASGIEGCIKVRRRKNDPDRFFVDFFAATNVDPYKAGYTYIVPDIKDFSIVDFEDGPVSSCRERLDKFADRLKKGTLNPYPKNL